MSFRIHPTPVHVLACGCLLACVACEAVTGLDQLEKCVDPCSAPNAVADAGASSIDSASSLQRETSIEASPNDSPMAMESARPDDDATKNPVSSPDANVAPDVSAPADAYADGQDAGAASTFCATLSPHPLFCEDFDGRPLPGAWNTFNQVGGTLTLDKATFVSAPNSLLARDKPPTGQAIDNALQVAFPMRNAPSTLALEFELQLALVDPTPNAAIVIASIDFFDAAANRYTLQFALMNRSGVVSVLLEEESGFTDGGTAYVAHTLRDPLAVGQWTDVLLSIALSSNTTGQAKVSFDKTQELDTPLRVTVPATKVQLDIGSRYEAEPAMGWNVLYDNITFNQ